MRVGLGLLRGQAALLDEAIHLRVPWPVVGDQLVVDAWDNGQWDRLGSAVVAAYQINTGPAIQTPLQGWGAGIWGNNTWGVTQAVNPLRLWSQMNFGQNLLRREPIV